MHRSGTSILTKSLSKLGVFFGTKLDPNMESLFFQKLNIKIMNIAGSTWYNPEPFANYIDNDKLLLGHPIFSVQRMLTKRKVNHLFHNIYFPANPNQNNTNFY